VWNRGLAFPHHNKIIHHIAFSNVEISYLFDLKPVPEIKINGLVVLPVYREPEFFG
jgi:hypothetical protein